MKKIKKHIKGKIKYNTSPAIKMSAVVMVSGDGVRCLVMVSGLDI